MIYFLFLCLTGLVSVAVTILQTIPHKYDLMMTTMTWPVAQNYCKEKYNDLATILSVTDWLRFNKEAASKGLATPAWIGLYNDINSWRWSFNDLLLKNVPYTYWYTGHPTNGLIACAVIGYNNYWFDAPCTDLRPFICYSPNFNGADRFIGIANPPMTWFDAQAYCRAHHTDLASSLNSTDNEMLAQVRNVQGTSWFGLYRDSWKWTDGTIASNLTWAPGEPNNYAGIENCAVIDKGLLRDFPCTSLCSFFCHTNFPVRSQTMRLQVKSDGRVFDPNVQASILLQVQQTLEENGMLENSTVTWKVQPDGNIFHKKKKNDL